MAAAVFIVDPGRMAWAARRQVRAKQSAKVLRERLVGCTVGADCDDGNGCTTDRCVNNSCVHVAEIGCVPCNFEAVCPPIDVVFVMDTSGSMADEAAALCANMAGVVADLDAAGIVIRPVFLGITEVPGGPFFSCLSNTVIHTLGAGVPGNYLACEFPGTFSAKESWGPATAIVAERFGWTANAKRVVIPMSDEGPCDGSYPEGCNDPGDDRNSILNAIAIANINNVKVMPIMGTGADACSISLAQDLAGVTGGLAFQTKDPGTDLASAIRGMLLGLCDGVPPCDDGDPCTIEDVCSNTGVCLGTPLESLSCTTDDDCPNATCNTGIGTCECVTRPDLQLVPHPDVANNGECLSMGDDLTVDIRLGVSSPAIVGGQFNVVYDPAVLDFLDFQLGGAVDPNSPFNSLVSKVIDEDLGRVFVAIGTEFKDPGSHGEVVMVSLHFRAIAACTSTELCFTNGNPKDTLLVDNSGTSVLYVPSCTGELPVSGGVPILSCPDGASINAEPGETSAPVTWATPSVTGGCGETIDLMCSSSTPTGGSVNTLVPGGGRFPIGMYSFQCSAMDACHQSVSCAWDVNILPEHLAEIDVQLSPTVVGGSLNRCIEFAFYDNCATPAVVREVVSFGGPFAFSGMAQSIQVKLPIGNYLCATATDPLHTLRATASVEIQGDRFVVDFTKDPAAGGHWLVGGNLNGDGAIDLLDLIVLNNQMSTVLPANTECGLVGPHADINGDGIVDVLDNAILSSNFLRTEEPRCCFGRSGDSLGVTPVTSMTIKELRLLGMGYLSAADGNADGTVTAAEMQRYMHSGERY